MTAAAPVAALEPVRLWPWSVFAALIAAAGLPIYIHAPKFYVDEYGVGLASLGLVLFGLRLIDVVQDPALGWLSERLRARRGAAVTVAVAVMAAAMVALFALPPPVAPLLWFAVTLTALFSAFSFLTITFYAQGVNRAFRMGSAGHVRLAGWREAGALAGISAAAVAPVVLAGFADRPFAAFALGFAGFALVALWAMRGEWRDSPALAPAGLRELLGDPQARRLLVIALVNAAPVAVTSTLFLFFVESRLAAPGLEGPLLLLFFLAAAASAPVWSRLALAHGPRRVLVAGMALAILSFAFTLMLGAGDVAAFALICAASGAALGADMVLLPAIFARHVSARPGGEARAFGLWSFANKLALAFAAAILLPALDFAGFAAGADNPAPVLTTLTLLYAALPCALKCAALAILLASPMPET